MNIYEVSSKFAWIKAKREKLHKDHWDPWFNRLSSLGGAWGKYKEAKNLFSFIMLVAVEHGYFSEYFKTPKELSIDKRIKIATDDEILLMISDPEFETRKDLIELRLKGELKPIPQDQDIVDEFIRLEHKFKRIRTIHSAYKRKLTEYARELIVKNDRSNLIILRIADEKYFFLSEDHSPYQLKLFEDNIVHHNI